MITTINEYKMFESNDNKLYNNAVSLYSVFISNLDNIRKKLISSKNINDTMDDYNFVLNVNSVKGKKIKITHVFDEYDDNGECNFIVEVIITHNNDVIEKLTLNLVYYFEFDKKVDTGYYNGPEYIVDGSEDEYKLHDVYIREYSNKYDNTVYEVTGDFTSLDKFKGIEPNTDNNEIWYLLDSRFDEEIKRTVTIVQDELMNSGIVLYNI